MILRLIQFYRVCTASVPMSSCDPLLLLQQELTRSAILRNIRPKLSPSERKIVSGHIRAWYCLIKLPLSIGIANGMFALPLENESVWITFKVRSRFDSASFFSLLLYLASFPGRVKRKRIQITRLCCDQLINGALRIAMNVRWILQ